MRRKTKRRLKAGIMGSTIMAGALTGALACYGITQKLLYEPNQVIKIENAQRPQYTIAEPEQAPSEDSLDIVISSNNNPSLAQRNVNDLKSKGFKARLEEIALDGKKFYRTVVNAAEGTEDAILKGLKATNYLGAGYFFKKPGTEEVKADPDGLFGKVEREEYIRGASLYIRMLRTYSKQGPIPAAESNRLAALIYDAAAQRKVPPIEYSGIIAKESAFNNVEGDLQLKTTYSHAQGYPQIRKPAIQHAVAYANAKRLEGLPSEPPSDIMANPDLQMRLGAHYFGLLLDVHGNIEKAINRYNGPLGAQRGYAADVLKRAKDIKQYIDNPTSYANTVARREAAARRQQASLNYASSNGSD